MWVLFGLFSAFFLGFYDAIRKKALNDNAVSNDSTKPIVKLAVINNGYLGIFYFGISDTSQVIIIHTRPIKARKSPLINGSAPESF